MTRHGETCCLVLVALVFAAGCGQSGSGEGATATPRTTSAAASPTGSPTPSPSVTGTATETPLRTPLACAALAGASIAGARITYASVISAADGLPEYCKVGAKIEPALNFEIRLPSDWNQKIVFIGGSGLDGFIPAPSDFNLSPGILMRRYATIGTDSGHQASFGDGSWALNNPDAIADYGYRSRHTVLLAAREIITALAATPIRRTYFEGSSSGGREALIEAQRFPEEWDGVIAREPVLALTALFLSENHIAQQVFRTPGGFLPAAAVTVLAQAVLTACDGLDNLEDGIVSNVAACRFDPVALRCEPGSNNDCLTDAQILTVNTVHAPLQLGFALANGLTGYPRWPLGTEASSGAWPLWITGPSPNPPASLDFSLSDQVIRYFVTSNPDLDSLAFSPDDYMDQLSSLSHVLDATDPDLSAFAAHGGKLILWHGWGDYGANPYSTVAYYEQVVAAAGGQEEADRFVRFYTSPGVDHLEGGPGAPTFDLLGALDAWIEEGTAPGDLVAYKFDPQAGALLPFRPLCRYPKYPRYDGVGDPHEPSSFPCALPTED